MSIGSRPARKPAKALQRGAWLPMRRLTGAVLSLLAAFLAGLAGPGPAAAQGLASEGWVLMGSQEIDLRASGAVIDVSAAKGQVRSIRLVAARHGAAMSKVVVHFADGGRHDEERPMNMNPRDRTRPIGSGADRFVDRVELTYRPNSRLDRADTALIEVWGQQDPRAARAERPASTAASAPGPAAPPPPSAAQASATPSLPPPAPPPPAARPTPPAAIPTAAPGPAQSSAPPVAPAPAPSVAAPAAPAPVLAPVLAPVSAQAPAASAPPAPPASPAASAGSTTAGGTARSVALVPPPAPRPQAAAPPPQTTPSGPPPAEPQQRHGLYIGRQTLTSSASAPERIEIGPGAGRLSSVRLRALESDVEIERASVVYVDGATEPLALAGPLRTGATTPWLTVRSDRFVAAVEVVRAQRAGARGTPTLEAYGLYADDWLLPGGEGSRTSGGWVRLGAQTAVARIGYDTLGFEIGANKGGFKKVRIEARDRAISVSELKVLYASGEVEIVRFGQKVSAGASSTAVDLRGASRVIKEIQVKTRARFIDRDARARDAAIIEVWGLL